MDMGRDAQAGKNINSISFEIPLQRTLEHYLLAKAQQQAGEAVAAKAPMQNIPTSPWWADDVETQAVELGMKPDR